MQNPTIPTNDIGVPLGYGAYHSAIRTAVYPVSPDKLLVLDTTQLENLILSQEIYPGSGLNSETGRDITKLETLVLIAIYADRKL